MKMLTTLAWRNIWRNRRRTYITSASILFAVLFAIFMVSIQKGAWDQMVNNVVNFYVGYAQLQEKTYREEPELDKAFIPEAVWQQWPDNTKGFEGWVPRLESFALASSGQQTHGVLVVGTDPKAEAGMTDLANRVEAGRYFEADVPEALLAEGVAERLKLDVGDTLVLISQGFRGVNAAGKYPVVGIVRFGSPELNKQMVYLPLSVAQNFFGAEERVSSMALHIASADEVSAVVKSLQTRIDTSQYALLDWQAMMPELLEAREVDVAGNYIILLVLYLIIAFGIFGTILMMTRERQYEFGVLVSIGMHRWKLALIVWMEVVFLGLLGAVAGMVVSFPLVLYFKLNPIDFGAMSEDMAKAYERFGFEPLFPATLEWSIFLSQALFIVIINTLLAIYPLVQIFRLRPMEAMRS